MGRRLRLGLAGHLVELTTRTIHARYLLKPSSQVNLTIKGTVGRAQRRTGLRICALVFMSNHYHMLVLPDSEKQLMEFMHYVHFNLARQLGRLYGWRERFWSDRYGAIAISHEPEAQIAKFRYVLEHGVKEGLVKKPSDWPGVHCARELTSGSRRIHGIWHERTAEGEVRRSGRAIERIGRRDFLTNETIELTPAPFLDESGHDERKRFFRKMLRSIEKDWAARRRAEGTTKVLGRKRIEQMDPLASPDNPKRSRAPMVHAATRETAHDMLERYRSLLRKYRRAAEQLRAGLEAQFPEGSFPPAQPFIPYSRAGPQ